MTAHRTAGAFAEYVTAAQAPTALVPAGPDLATAGALGLAGTPAFSAIGAIDPLPGETVLISGAAGSVGGSPRSSLRPAAQTLERLAADVVNGQLTVPVQRTCALADVPRALADFAAGTRGKPAISLA